MGGFLGLVSVVMAFLLPSPLPGPLPSPLPPPDAPAAVAAVAPSYVALGDGHAAGVGAGARVADGTQCRRSRESYPALVAGAAGLALNLQACAGATTADVTVHQLDPLDADTDFVSLTVGANDIGLSGVLSICVTADTRGCLTAVDGLEARIIWQLPGLLRHVFSAARAAAPHAVMVATNYPRVFNLVDCSWLTSFQRVEMIALNRVMDDLSQVIRTAAARSGIGFSDLLTRAHGHALCDADPWFHHVGLFTSVEFQPSGRGFVYGYAPAVAEALGVRRPPGRVEVPALTVGGQTSTDSARERVKLSGIQG